VADPDARVARLIPVRVRDCEIDPLLRPRIYIDLVAQLGTVGSGNHYVDLMRDETGLVWIGVHFGSRGLGHTCATRYLKLAGGKDGMNVPPAVIDEDSEIGRWYIAAMQLAGRYAGREWVVGCAGSSAEISPTPFTITRIQARGHTRLQEQCFLVVSNFYVSFCETF
jgi:hypothetical protein